MWSACGPRLNGVCFAELLSADGLECQVNYVVQEAIVVIRDIFRKYPGQRLDSNYTASRACLNSPRGSQGGVSAGYGTAPLDPKPKP